MVYRASSYYRRVFKAERDVTQGGLLSPTIFNLMVGAFLLEWIYQTEQTGFDATNTSTIVTVFYADGGLIAARDPTFLQDAFKLVTALFDRVGLETNNTKTKVMVFLPGRIHTCLPENACLSRMDALHRASKKTGQMECHLAEEVSEAEPGLPLCHAAPSFSLPPADRSGRVPARG